MVEDPVAAPGKDRWKSRPGKSYARNWDWSENMERWREVVEVTE